MAAQKKYILVTHYCEQTKVEKDFLQNLHEYGLVLIVKQNAESYIDEKDISKIERLFRLYKDLSINYEGLDVINRMLKRMQQMEKHMQLLQKKLALYE